LLPAFGAVAWREENKVLYGLVGAFAVVALGFLMAFAWTLHASRESDIQGRDLLENSLPTVTQLMRTRRAALRDLDVDVEVMEQTHLAPAQLVAEVVAARAEVDQALNAAMSTPEYPGERELYERDVKPRLARLDKAIDELAAFVTSNVRDDRRMVADISAVDHAAKDLDWGLASLADLNQRHALEAAQRIVSSRAETARIALGLESAAALVAIAATVIAVRAARHFQRQARRKLEHESERAGELDVLAQRVAHDLMSPLGAVALSLGSIQRTHPDPDTTRAVERAHRALERSKQMVQGIYAFSGSGARPVPGATAPLRATIVDAADELLAAEAQSPPTIDVQPFDEVEVAMDAAVLGVVVSNLLSNASKYSREAAVRHVTVRASADESRVHVEVEDTGPGIPPGLEQTIFEPYRRAPGVQQPGLGLGLATVQRLVLAHGGTLGVHNAPSGGAVFWFDLPRAQAAPAEARAEQPAPAHGGEPHPAH
jgi:signal transduction histidine kinase